jgi:RimJ/RimL family protein N-acetyltransferase
MQRRPTVDDFDPIEVGAGVILRRWLPRDASSVAEACDDAEIARWLPLPSPYTVRDAERYLALTSQWWEAGEAYAVAIANDQMVLGAISLGLGGDRPSIGYWLRREARGRGIATRAVKAFAQWAASTFKLSEVWIFVQPANAASRRVAERAGFIEQDERVVAPDAKDRMTYRLRTDVSRH